LKKALVIRVNAVADIDTYVVDIRFNNLDILIIVKEII